MNTEDKLLGREDLLKTYLIYVKQRGKSREVLKARLDAMLRAYNPNWGMNQLQDFLYGILIDKECSDEKLNEIYEITGFRLGEDPHDPYADVYNDRRDMFHSLLMYRVQVEEVRRTYDGVLECSRGFMNGVIHAQKLNKQIIEMMAEKVDRVIYLLLGDKYDNSFTQSELRRKYGYPAVNDRELRDMIIDEMPD
jgi:hypothetical protein